MQNLITNPKKLSEKVISFWTLHTLITYMISLLIGLSIIFLSNYFNWKSYLKISFVIIFAIILVSFAIEIFYVRYIKYNIFKYYYNDNLVKIEYGFFVFKTYRVIPTNKIYSVDIYQGPLLKKYNIYNVKLITMANTHEIEGIELNKAEEIQKKLNSIKDG